MDFIVLGSENHFPAGKPITGDHSLVPVLRHFVETNSPLDRQLVIDGHQFYVIWGQFWAIKQLSGNYLGMGQSGKWGWTLVGGWHLIPTTFDPFSQPPHCSLTNFWPPTTEKVAKGQHEGDLRPRHHRHPLWPRHIIRHPEVVIPILTFPFVSNEA